MAIGFTVTKSCIHLCTTCGIIYQRLPMQHHSEHETKTQKPLISIAFIALIFHPTT